MKVAIYTRVSTDRQTADSQLLELRSFCSRRGWNDPTEYHDTISGAKFSRIGLEQLMAAVRRGRVQVVVCFKLDRLGRSLAHLAQIVAELNSHGVALVCTSQGIDTSDSNPAGRLQLGVLMAVAEFEREIIRERVKAGLQAARARGTKLGRPARLHRKAAEIARMLSEGLGLREIARRLAMPASSVHAIRKGLLKRPAVEVTAKRAGMPATD